MIVAILIFLVIAGMGLLWLAVCLWAQGRTNRRATASASWPTVAGEIVAAELVAYNSEFAGQGEGLSIRYGYTVSGTRYESDRVRPDSMQGRDEDDRQRYPVGSPVDVRYNPSKPSEAVLELGTPSQTYRQMGWAGFAIFILAGITFALMWLLV